MKKEIKINKRKQLLKESYCGPITYCALTSKDQKQVSQFHEKARVKPSLGFFYLSFHKLDKNLHSFVESKGNFLNPQDSKLFDTMWDFEGRFQKGISKEKFISQVLANSKKLYSKYKKNITILKKPKISRYLKIIEKNILKGSPVAFMGMIDINRHNNKSKFLIPHWMTIHGIKGDKHKKYLVFDSYIGDSWYSEKKLVNEMLLNKKFGFSPQIVIKS